MFPINVSLFVTSEKHGYGNKICFPGRTKAIFARYVPMYTTEDAERGGKGGELAPVPQPQRAPNLRISLKLSKAPSKSGRM